ncbi:MAG TPA: helix-hairpin-helix domain-containing protein, partial [Polyangiaceae bacterium]|nr:helix-hairpin-helix domain-containing protein [Polyangiaceae bacterium]
MTLTVQGEVEKISYENEETGFRVVRLGQVSGLPEHRQLTLVGTMPPLGAGTTVRAAGRLEQHTKHGLRFVVQSVIIIAPDTLAGLEKFLASGVLSGIGEGLAKRLVKYFGLDTLRVLDDESHRLSEVPGLGKKKVEQVRQSWAEHKLTSNLLLLLKGHGISGYLSKKIVEQFGDRSAEIVERHPYRLALQVSGIGFKTADQIARTSGLSMTDPERAQAGLIHQLLAARDQGHCYCD